MSRLSLLAAFALTACNTAGSIQLDSFDPTLAEGHTADEHTEVAPGVHLLSSVVNSGAVHYVDLTPEQMAERAEAASQRTMDPTYCYNYDSGSYADQLSGGTMFMDNPSWYGSTYAYSYDYDGLGDAGDQDYEQVSAYMWNYSRHAIGQLYATAYVYINGSYAGYVTDSQMNATTALAYATFDAECVDGSLSVEMRTYHSWSSGIAGTQQYLYLSNTSTASVECCPAR